MDKIEEVSFLLGELKAGITQGNEDRIKLFNLVRRMDEELKSLSIKLESHMKEEEIRVERLEKVENDVRELEVTKTRVMVLLSTVSSGVGAITAKLLGISSLSG